MRPRVPSVSQLPKRRSKSTAATTEPLRVAVLGGGISGLSAAYRLSQDPNTHVMLYEKSGNPGGWLQSERLNVRGKGDSDGGGSVLFEWGPRNLRVGDKSCQPTIDLLQDLGLQDSALCTYKSSPAARNRYVYYNKRLARVPSLSRLLDIPRFVRDCSKAPFRPLISGLLGEPMRPSRKASSSHEPAEETIADFVTRRLGGRQSVDDLLSAVCHGIYAGNIYKLSATCLMPTLWFYESTPHKVLLSLLFQGLPSRLKALTGTTTLENIEAKQYRTSFGAEVNSDVASPQSGLGSAFGQDISMVTLKDGMQELASTLGKTLSAAPNVDVKWNTTVTSIHKQERGAPLRIAHSGHHTADFDYAISTIPGSQLSEAVAAGFPKDSKLSQLLKHGESAVNVMVVNLFYDDPNLVKMPGFGYLIPLSAPLDQNPERGLGVVFSSQISPDQDTASGTKLTVMLGGHLWDGRAESDLPDEEKGVEMAKSLLGRHMNITDQPVLAKARLQRNAIPQYNVHHLKRMLELHEELLQQYGGSLMLTGSWFTGAGVNDCLRSARLVALAASRRLHDKSGLDKYTALCAEHKHSSDKT